MIDTVRHFRLAHDPFSARAGVGVGAPEEVLDDGQARALIETRLAQAGGRGLFTREAVNSVVAAAGGRAQRLRWLAGLAMLEATLGGARVVDGGHVAVAMAQAGLRPLAGVAVPRAESPPLSPPSPPPPLPRSAPPPRAGVLGGLSLTKAAAGAMVVMGLILGVALMGPVSVNQPPHRAAVARADRLAPTQPIAPVNAGGATISQPGLASPSQLSSDRLAPPPPAPATLASNDAGPSTPLALRPLSRARPRAPLLPPPDPAPTDAVATDDTVPDDAPRSGQSPARAAAQPRLFVHYRPADRDAAADLARRLEARGWTIAALREVDISIRAPNTRFFYLADAAAAHALADDLSDEIGQRARARDMRSYPRPPSPGTIEIWLPPPD